MAIDLVIPVSNIKEIFGTGVNQYNTIRLYSATDRGAAYSLVTSISLIADDTTYSYTDSTGDENTWYKVALYNSVLAVQQSLDTIDPSPATRDTLTLKEYRQMVLKKLSGKVYNATAVGTTTIAAKALQDSGTDSAYYNGWHIYRPDATSADDYDRRVVSFSGSTLTHGGADYIDVDDTDIFEIVPVDLDFTDFNDSINMGLTNTRWLYRYEFGATSGKNQYSLPHFIEDENSVKQIWRRFGGTADTYIWRPIEHNGGWAKVRGSNFQCTLDVTPSLSENEVLAIECWRPGEKLGSETDFTRVHPDWALAAGLSAVLKQLYTQDMVRHQTSKYESLLQMWTAELVKEAKKYLPKGGVKVQLPQPWGSMPRV